MTIKLKGSSDGSVSLSAPADTSPTGTDITLTLPTDAGSANQFIKNSGTAGTLDYSSMIEDNSGNVGIGQTSPAQLLHLTSSGSNAFLQFSDSGSGGSAAQVRIGSNGNDLVVLNNTSSNTAAERMRISSSGNVGLGTASPQDKLHVHDGRIAISATATEGSDTVLGTLMFRNGSNNNKNAKIHAYQEGGTSGAGLRFYTRTHGDGTNTDGGEERLTINSTGHVTIADEHLWFGTSGKGIIFGAEGGSNRPSIVGNFTSSSDNNIVFNATGSERMRIDGSGNVLIGRTSVGATGNGHSIRGGDSAIFSRDATGETVQVCRNNSTGDLVQFRRNGTVCGEIVNNGSTSVAYNTSSDYRLKENVVAIADGIERVKGLKPSRFNFIAEPSQTVDGFLAHEAQAVVPECATGVKDWVDEEGNPKMQGIDQSKLVPLLTAALQEAIAKIETLETKVAALEAAE